MGLKHPRVEAADKALMGPREADAMDVRAYIIKHFPGEIRGYEASCMPAVIRLLIRLRQYDGDANTERPSAGSSEPSS
jgi:hypothetical protein